MDNKLERLLNMQRVLQRNSFGYDFAQMTADQRVQYIRDQHQAIGMELSEALDEVDWKPWTSGPRTVNRNEFMNELIDVLHIWINMALAVSGSMSSTELSDEIFTRYALKNRTNARRQADSYDGRSTKCGGCGRALDESDAMCTRDGDQGFCAKNNVNVNYLDVVDEAGAPAKLIVAPIKPTICLRCNQPLDEHGCELPTTERWGYCMASHGDVKQLPPIKIPTDS